MAWSCTVDSNWNYTCEEDPAAAAIADDRAALYAEAGWGPEKPTDCLLSFAMNDACNQFSKAKDAINRLLANDNPVCQWYGWDAERRLTIAGAFDYTKITQNAQGQAIRGEFDPSTSPGNGTVWLTPHAFDAGWDPANTIAHEESHYAGYPDSAPRGWSWGTAYDQGNMCSSSR